MISLKAYTTRNSQLSTDDDQHILEYKRGNFLILDSSSVCMQHTLLVACVSNFWLTVIGIYLAAYKWYHWIPISTSLVTTLLCIPSVFDLNVKLLFLYAICSGTDFMLKVLSVATLIYYNVKINEDCNPFGGRGREEDCPGHMWRYQLLNMTSGTVFYFFTAVLELILFTFALYLIYTVKKYRPLFREKNAYSIPLKVLESRQLNPQKMSKKAYWRPILKLYAIAFVAFPLFFGLCSLAGYLQVLGDS